MVLQFDQMKEMLDTLDLRVTSYEETKDLLNRYYSSAEQARVFDLETAVYVRKI